MYLSMGGKGKANEPRDMGREEMPATLNFYGDEGNECGHER
jgi:hypothetical protein